MRPELRILRQHMAENGLKLTRQRMAIAERFLASEGHLNAEELYHDLRQSGQPVGLATVYRTLKMLVDSGLAQERHFPDGAARYENVYGEPQHDHLVCDACGRIIEVETPVADSIYHLAFERHGFVASGHRLVITGICADCQSPAAHRTDRSERGR